jgi:hypothetical protein
MPRKRSKLFIIVGKPWPDEVKVTNESTQPKEIDPKVNAVLALVLGAGLLVAVFAGFALIRGDSELIEKIFNLAERVLLVAVGWIGHAASKEK